jgi:hypothetical protein
MRLKDKVALVTGASRGIGLRRAASVWGWSSDLPRREPSSSPAARAIPRISGPR